MEGDLSPRGEPPFVGEVPMAVPPEKLDGVERTAYVKSSFANAESAGTRVARGAMAVWEEAGRNMRDALPLAVRVHADADGGRDRER